MNERRKIRQAIDTAIEETDIRDWVGETTVEALLGQATDNVMAALEFEED